MSKSSRSIVELKDYVDTLTRHIKEYVNTLVDNLRTFVNEKCDDERVYVDTRFTAVNDAVRLANDAMQVRLEHLNNLYQQINKMGENYPTKSDLSNLSGRYDLSVKQYDTDIRYLRESKAEIAGKASAESVSKVQENVNKSQVFVVIGLSISLLSLVCGGVGMLTAVISIVLRVMGL